MCYNIQAKWCVTHFDIVLYRAPSYDGEALSYVCKLVECLSRFHSSKYPNILLGDINFPKLNLINYCGASDNIHQKFSSFVIQFSYHQLVTFPTRESNILDIILTTESSLFSTVAPDLQLGTSDHSSVRFELSLPANFRLRNDLYCVEWGVKLYSLTHLLTILEDLV